MATQLNLEEQEQLDELKAFWSRWGNLITWSVTLVLVAFAAYNGWNWWQGQQAAKASVMFDEIDRAVTDGDAAKSAKVFADLRERYPRTLAAQQAGLLDAKLQASKAKPDAAIASLNWVAEHGDDNHAALARLRLASVYLDKKAYADALKALDAVTLPAYAALANARRGDVLFAQGQRDAAGAAWRKAWDALTEADPLRRLVEAQLDSVGAAPPAPASAASAAAAA